MSKLVFHMKSGTALETAPMPHDSANDLIQNWPALGSVHVQKSHVGLLQIPTKNIEWAELLPA